MKTTYYTPTTWVECIGKYDMMQSSSPVKGDPTKPDPTTHPSSPARKLYV